MASKENLTFYAYATGPQADTPIRPAARERDWMDAADGGFPYRCLPLAMANQAGWVIGNPTAFTARWNGGPVKTGV